MLSGLLNFISLAIPEGYCYSKEKHNPMSTPENQNLPTSIPVKHRIPARMPSVCAHNVIVQSLPESIVVSFFETILPPKTEFSLEDLRHLSETGVISECVARITMTPQAFVEAAAAIERIAKGVRDAIEAAEKGESDA